MQKNKKIYTVILYKIETKKGILVNYRKYIAKNLLM